MRCPHTDIRLVNVRPGWIWRCVACLEIVCSVEDDSRER